MFHVASTARPKLVAKDFARVLKNLGHPLSYSKLLEAVAHMYGYASFGMMQRTAGGASPSPDDAAASPAVAEQRRIADRRANQSRRSGQGGGAGGRAGLRV
jgi:hypothetical protein